MSSHMTRYVAKITGVNPIAFDLLVRAKKTKIPAGVSLEQIPSPGNVKPKKRPISPIDDMDELAENMGDLGLGKAKGKGKKNEKYIKTNAKGKPVLDSSESEEEEKSAKTKRSTRALRTNMTAPKKLIPADEDEWSGIKPMNLDPFFKNTTAKPLFAPTGGPTKRTRSKSPTKRPASPTKSVPSSPTISTPSPYSPPSPPSPPAPNSGKPCPPTSNPCAQLSGKAGPQKKYWC